MVPAGITMCFVLLQVAFPAELSAGREADSLRAENRDLGGLLLDDASGSVRDLLNYSLQPFSWRTDDLVLLGISLAGVGIASRLDPAVDSHLRGHHNAILDAADCYGDLRFGQALTTAVYTGGLLSGYDDIRQTGRLLFKTLLYAGLLTSALKTAIGRARPYSDRGPFFFEPFEAEDDRLSFPSGHTTVAFAISTVLAKQFDNSLLSVVLYTVAGLTGISRIVRGQHWLSDVLASAVLAYGTGRFVTALESRSELPHSLTGIGTILLTPRSNGLELSIQL